MKARPVRIRDVQFSAETIRYYKYHGHKHVLFIEVVFHFQNRQTVYWMRCIRCRDLVVCGDDV